MLKRAGSNNGDISPEIELKPFSRRHLEATWEWVNRPEMKPLTGTIYPVSWRGHLKWYAALKDDPSRRFFAIVAAGAEHIGNAGVKKFHPENRSAELFIYIGDPAWRGRGIGTRATRLLADMCLKDFSLQKVYVTVFAYNDMALASYAKAGFEREAVWREHLYRGGRYHDVVVMSKTA